MNQTEATKIAIRKRLFFEAAQRSTIVAAHGFQWCPRCSGRGDVCIEHQLGTKRWAAFELCPDCQGEKIIPAGEADAQTTGGA